MDDQYLIAAREQLQLWRGFSAMFWHRSERTGQLHIKHFVRGSDERRDGNLVLVCYGCKSIEGDAGWDVTDLQIRKESDGSLTVLDTLNGIEIQCAAVKVFRDVFELPEE